LTASAFAFSALGRPTSEVDKDLFAMKSHIFHVHALSALHIGVGQAIGVVDLPIARERATQLPFAPGSGIKGVLRDAFSENPDSKVLFGPDSVRANDDAFAGALAVGDAKLLLLPVRSLAGVMAWATCPFVLRRYADDLALAGMKAPSVPTVESGKAMLTPKSVLRLGGGNDVVIDDLDLVAHESVDAERWSAHFRSTLFPSDAEAEKHFDPRFLILSDDEFGFLSETGTEVRARIRISSETGTVERGALWYEENLPAESVLWGLIGVGPSRERNDRRDAATLSAVFQGLVGDGRSLQMGGKATVGRGLVRFHVSGR